MKLFRTISSVFLALLLLVSSTSFAVGMHFCGGEVQKLSFSAAPELCEKQKELPPCHRHAVPDCCDDEMVIHNGDDFSGGAPVFPIAVHASSAAVVPDVILSEVIPSSQAVLAQFAPYDPPLPADDFTVAYCVFLI